MKDLIVKDNALINASYALDLVEQRLILLAILEARQNHTPNDKELTVYAETYIKQFDVHKNTAYQALKDACKNLFERRFSYQKVTLKGNIEHVASRWVQKISYVENEALVRLCFSDDVLPLIMRLEQQFTSYELNQVSGLSSAYAMRLYELLICWRDTGKTPVLRLEDIRNKLGVQEHEYQRLSNLKMRILDTALAQINTHTDINASYEQHKAGRVITGFTFSFQSKVAVKPEAKPQPKRKPKAAPAGLTEPSKAVLPEDIMRLARDFSSLNHAGKEQVLKNVQSELDGLKESQFIVELSAYNATGSTAIFQLYKDYFARGLALLGYL